MRHIGWLLLAIVACLPSEVHAQGMQVGPYGFTYVRRGDVFSSRSPRRGRVYIRVGFLAPVPYGLASLNPLDFPPVMGPIRICGLEPLTPPTLSTVPPLLQVPRSLVDDPELLPVPGPEVPRIIIPEVPRPPERPRLPEKPPMPPIPLEKEPIPPPRKEEPKEPPKKEEPRPPRKRSSEWSLPRPPDPPDDPREAQAQLVERGQEAFLELEYGRAVQRFRQAIRLTPDEPMPRFLLAQALLAQRKYHEAHDAIQVGLRLRPNWPTATFHPLDLYGAAVGEYPDHLSSRQETLRKHPDDPVLLFLLAYQMWFDGRREEAGPLFRRALPRSAHRDAIDRFLRELPGVDL